MSRRAVLFSALLLACVGCDHATKQLAVRALEDVRVTALAGDVVRFELTANSGAFLSMGAGLPAPLREALFLGLMPALMAIFAAATWRAAAGRPRALAGLALVLGGGLGNWLDRLFHDGRVTDFVSLGVGSFRTGIFNVADLLVLAGIALLLSASRRGATGALPPGGPGEPEPGA